VGYCQAGLVRALTQLFPGNRYRLNYFALPHKKQKESALLPYTGDNCTLNASDFFGKVFRAASVTLPLPYSFFFGSGADITHFFNYIVPHGVKGKTTVTVHDMVYKAFPETMSKRTLKLLEFGLGKSLKRADAIVTDSLFSKSEIIKYFPQYEKKITVVPCGVDTDVFRKADVFAVNAVKEKYGIPGEYFLYLGTVEPRKNLERLINGYCLFAGRNKNCPQLVLAGAMGWRFDGIMQAARQSDNIKFTGYLPSADTVPLLSGALGFVFPSVYEGFGLPPLEAMACGTPVIVSGEASLPEVVGDAGLYADAYSEQSIADALEKLCSDSRLREDLSRKGLERAGMFSWTRAAELLFKVYSSLNL
jgi:glycosyltransferase involved in cell wall biosynthesis